MKREQNGMLLADKQCKIVRVFCKFFGTSDIVAVVNGADLQCLLFQTADELQSEFEDLIQANFAGSYPSDSS